MIMSHRDQTETQAAVAEQKKGQKKNYHGKKEEEDQIPFEETAEVEPRLTRRQSERRYVGVS